MKITIDGPSGAGKSSIAKEIAKRIGIIYIDTGAMYRTVGLYCLRNGIDTKDGSQVEQHLEDIDITIAYENNEQSVILNGENVTALIRTNEVSMAASDVAKIISVRMKLVELQRKLAENQNVIMDGRDAGTYILPDAEKKIFLTATAEKRAERRYLELDAAGQKVDYNEVLREIIKRDKNDSERTFSPLKKAVDAVVVDTSDMDFDESVKLILEIIGDIDA